MIVSAITYAEDRLPPDQQPIVTENNCAFEAFVALISAPITPPMIVAIVGKQGMGKTIAIGNYISNFSSVLAQIVRVKIPTCATALTVGREFCRSAGEVPPLGNKHEVAKKAIEVIVDNGTQLIFVDEADRLSAEAFDLFRFLHDATGCRIAFVGRPNCLSVIEQYEQLANRMGPILEFEDPTLDEVLDNILPKLSIPHWQYDSSNKADREMGKLLWERTGNFRRLRICLDLASSFCRVNEESPITKKTLNLTFKYLRIKRKARPANDYSTGPMERDSELRRDAKVKHTDGNAKSE